MKLAERAAIARRELSTRLADFEPPPSSRVRVTHRRRRVLQVAGAALVVAVAAAGVTASVRREDAKTLVLTPPEPLQPFGDGPAIATVSLTTTNALKYVPDQLQAPTGLVRITLTNTGSGAHRMEFDDERVRFARIDVTEAGETHSSRAFFPTPGTYTFYDSIAGHREVGEEGTVTVTGEPRTLEQAEAEAARSNTDVISHLELESTTVVSGGAISGTWVIENNSGAPFRFGVECETLWQVVLIGESATDGATFQQPCLPVRDLPPGRTALPFTLHAIDGRGALPPGTYVAVLFVTTVGTPLPPQPRVTVTPAAG
jgi:plastocyanin